MSKRNKQLLTLFALVAVLIVGMVAQRGERVITRTQRPAAGNRGEVWGTVRYRCDSQPAVDKTRYIYRFDGEHKVSLSPAEPVREDGSFRVHLATGDVRLFLSDKPGRTTFAGPGTAVEVRPGSVTNQDLFTLVCPELDLVWPSWDSTGHPRDLRTPRPEFRWAFHREDVQYEVEVAGPGPLRRFRSSQTSVIPPEDLPPGPYNWRVNVLSAAI
jgi:hypothetical protein